MIIHKFNKILNAQKSAFVLVVLFGLCIFLWNAFGKIVRSRGTWIMSFL